jgi:hypothetical protein
MAARFQIKYFNSYWLKKATNGGNLGGTGTINSAAYTSSWPGLLWDPTDYPEFPADVYDGIEGEITRRNWVIEEARIRGGYNNTSTSYGVRAYLKEDENNQSILDNQIIYSGIYNSTTSSNETNVFSTADTITKTLDPSYGSIQKMFAEDSNMLILQESKVSNVLVDKDAIYSAQGQAAVTSTNLVLGQVQPYLGEYGISKNPESFAVFGFRKYFADKYRNAILRLSRDGVTEISQSGMNDYFRDQLSEISDEWQNYTSTYVYANNYSGTAPYFVEITDSTPEDIEIGMNINIQLTFGTKPINARVLGLSKNVASTLIYIDVDPSLGATNFPLANSDIVLTKFIKDEVVGGYDTHDDFYMLSMKKAILDRDTPEVFAPLDQTQEIGRDTYNGNTQTLAFDETVKGWTSFYTFRPLLMDNLRNKFYTSKGSEVWLHHSEREDNRSSFYGTRNDSSITFVFNANPSMTKNFNTIAYEGDNGWQVESMVSDLEGKNQLDASSQWTSKQDAINPVKSYEEGKYTDGGVTYRSGFNRKENRYVANIINNSERRIGEVVFGNEMSGIKGYFVTVKMSTDNSTDVGGAKELFAVSSNFVMSSY